MIDENSKLIANYLKDAFVGTPSVQRYYASDNIRFVDIIKTPHKDNVTYIGTIGGFRRKMKGQPKLQSEIRVEIVTAVQENYTEIISQTLGFLILSLDTDRKFYRPGTIVEDAIPENALTTMRHVYLCDPFLWDNGLPSLKINNVPVAFLYVLPITEREKELYEKVGTNAFEEYLQQQNVRYFDLQR